MRVSFLLLLLLLLISVASIAQTSRFGAKMGMNISHLGTDIERESNSVFTGYNVGFGYSIDLQEFGLGVEALFSRRGGQITTLNAQIVERYNYLDIPISLKWYAGKGWNIHGGPYFSILLDATEKITTNGQETVNDIREFIDWSDYGFFVGFGYDFDFGLYLELRYNYGMKDVDNIANVERRHRFGQASVAYFF